MLWTDQRCNELRRLWAEGHSASQIAAELGEGISRSGIIGKAHRLGLEGRVQGKTVNKIREPRRLKPQRSPSLNMAKVNALHQPLPQAVTWDGVHITLMDLTNQTCRWPVNDDVRVMLYCGLPEADISAGRPYCRYHARIAHG